MSDRRLQLETYEDGSARVELADPKRIAELRAHTFVVGGPLVFGPLFIGGGTTLLIGALALSNPSLTDLWVIPLVALVFVAFLAALPMLVLIVVALARRPTATALRVDSHGLRVDGRLVEWNEIEAIDGDDVTLQITHGDGSERLDLRLYRPEGVQRLRVFLRSTLASRSEIPDPSSSRGQLRRLIGASTAV